MKKTIVFGLLGIILAFSFAFTSCLEADGDGGGGSQNTSLEGTWNKTYQGAPLQLILSGSNWTVTANGVNFRRGTFSTSGNKSVFTVTHKWTGGSWGSDSAIGVVDYEIRGSTMYVSNFTAEEGNMDYAPMFEGTWTKS